MISESEGTSGIMTEEQVSQKTEEANCDGLWTISHKKETVDGEKLWYRIANTNEIPMFLSETHGNRFFSLTKLNSDHWVLHPLSFSFLRALLLLTENKDWTLRLFYSYDPKHKAWGTKRLDIHVKEHYAVFNNPQNP